jgi:hypothetical protein
MRGLWKKEAIRPNTAKVMFLRHIELLKISIFFYNLANIMFYNIWNVLECCMFLTLQCLPLA